MLELADHRYFAVVAYTVAIANVVNRLVNLALLLVSFHKAKLAHRLNCLFYGFFGILARFVEKFYQIGHGVRLAEI